MKNRDNIIRSLNKRAENAFKKFGGDSQLYKSYESRILQVAKNDNQVRYKDGIIQIARGKASKSITENELAMLQRTATVKSVTERIRNTLKKEGIKPTKEAIMERYKKETTYNEIINQNKELLYTMSSAEYDEALAILKTKGRLKTYDELDKVVKAINNKDIKTRAEPKNLFEGL